MFFDAIPNEIKLHILQYLTTTQDVVAVKRTNKEGKRLGMDVTLWLEPLKQDFYFTESTANEYCTRLKKNYVELYQYCAEYKFNCAQTEALKQLQSNGLKPEHLKGRDWFDSDNYQNALIYLMTKRQPPMNATQAMAEIDNLSQIQAYRISKGCLRQEVIELSNYHQIEALIQLKSKGLTVEHLKGRDWFDEDQHQKALVYLMTKQQPSMNAAQAMAEIDNLSQIQAYGISEGLSRKEVIELSNPWKILALSKLKPKGLTVEHLKDKDWFDSDKHQNALIYLMTKQQPSMNAAQAMAEIDNLSPEQAYGISKGCLRQEVIELSNHHQIEALIQLKSKGLTVEHLKNQNWFNSKYHKDALIYLMTKRQPPINAEQAMAEIDNLSPEKACGISRELSRKEVTELSNPWQMLALVKLKPKNLKLEHLKDQDWFDNEKHLKALTYLMTKQQPPMNATQAMAEIKGLSSKQVKGISNGLSRYDIIEPSDDFHLIDASDKNENPVLANTNSYKPIFAPANAALQQAAQIANSAKNKIDEIANLVSNIFSKK